MGITRGSDQTKPDDNVITPSVMIALGNAVRSSVAQALTDSLAAVKLSQGNASLDEVQDHDEYLRERTNWFRDNDIKEHDDFGNTAHNLEKAIRELEQGYISHYLVEALYHYKEEYLSTAEEETLRRALASYIPRICASYSKYLDISSDELDVDVQLNLKPGKSGKNLTGRARVKTTLKDESGNPWFWRMDVRSVNPGDKHLEGMSNLSLKTPRLRGSGVPSSDSWESEDEQEPGVPGKQVPGTLEKQATKAKGKEI